MQDAIARAMLPMPAGPLRDFLERAGYSELCVTPLGLVVGIEKMLYTSAIVIGLDYGGKLGRYCYEKHEQALAALSEWEGSDDPPGAWIVYKGWPAERIGPGGDDRFPR